MRRSLVTLITLLFISFIFNGCGRYEEGPDFSIWPVKDRVVNTWEWAYALENGQNMTGEREGSTIEFTKEEVVKICTAADVCQEGDWNLISKKKKLQMIFNGEAVAYDILLLKKNEMWLHFSDTTGEIRWELVKAD